MNSLIYSGDIILLASLCKKKCSNKRKKRRYIAKLPISPCYDLPDSERIYAQQLINLNMKIFKMGNDLNKWNQVIL